AFRSTQLPQSQDSPLFPTRRSSDLGGSITVKQYGKRPIQSNYIPQDTPTWGKEFKDASIKYFNRSISVDAQGASMPHRNNYLSLDPTYKDSYGNPLIRRSEEHTSELQSRIDVVCR